MRTSISTMWAPVTTQGPSGVAQSALFQKHRKSSARWVLGIFAAISISISFVTPAFASWLSVDVSCSEIISIYGQTTCGTTPNLSPSPGETYTTSLSGGSANTSFSASASGIADYGTLGVSAYATATNFAGGDWYTRTSQLIGRSWSKWGDTFTIGGETGTYVDIQINLIIDIHDFDQAASGSMFSSAYLTFNTSYSNPVYGWCWEKGANGAACSYSAPLHIGSNEIIFTTSILAGTTSIWESSLFADAVVYNPAIGAGEVNINALNTAHTYFTVLTEGATMEWESGNDYSIPSAVPPSAVPEPATYTMLLAGLGLLGWTVRRRKQAEA